MKTQRRLILLVGLAGFVMLSGRPMWAQDDYPEVEVFGGYSYASLDNIGTISIQRRNAHGWGASLHGNVHKNFGVTADFGGHYGNINEGRFSTDFRVHEFLFGPRVAARSEHLTGFAHALFGFANIGLPNLRFSALEGNRFAMGIGGGLDVNLNKRVAARVFQFDYVPIHTRFGYSHSVRLKTGMVFKF